MWKPVGVVCLWLLLIAVPHLGSRTGQVSVPGVQLAAAVAIDESAEPAREEPPGRAADAGARPEAATAEVTIHFRNALDKTLTLVGAGLLMDGEPLTPVTNLSRDGDNVVFTGRVTPGPHVVSTHLICQGQSRGPFSYLPGYRWTIRSEHTLNVPDNRSVVFRIAAVRHKGINVPLNELVDVSVYNELSPEPLSGPGATEPAEPAP